MITFIVGAISVIIVWIWIFLEYLGEMRELDRKREAEEKRRLEQEAYDKRIAEYLKKNNLKKLWWEPDDEEDDKYLYY